MTMLERFVLVCRGCRRENTPQIAGAMHMHCPYCNKTTQHTWCAVRVPNNKETR